MNAFSPVAGTSVRAAAASDRRAIETYLAPFQDVQPFHLPAWCAGVERGCGQRAHWLVAERGGAIAGVLPLTEMRSALFGSALVSSGFAVGGGVVADDAETSDRLARSAWDLACRLGIGSVELRGGPVPEGWERREGLYAGFARDLPTGDDAILKSIPRKQRAEVRRAQSFGLGVRIGRDEADLADHYRVYSESVRNLGTPVFPRSLFQAMLNEFGAAADILTIVKDGNAIASVFSFYVNDTVYPYWGGGTSEARSARANELMYFELMRHAAARGCTRFDFGRSKLGTGAYAFKKNWGFEPVPLSYAVRTAGGSGGREINPLSPRYRLQVALWRKLPLWAANRIGPPIARGLG